MKPVERYELNKKLSYKDFLLLLGLKALAKNHNEFLTKIERSVAEIIGEKDSTDWSSEFVYDNATVESFLERLGVEHESQ